MAAPRSAAATPPSARPPRAALCGAGAAFAAAALATDPPVENCHVRDSAGPSSGSNVADAVYVASAASVVTGMTIPPGGMKPTRRGVALSTVRTSSGPSGPVSAALVSRPVLVPRLMTSRWKPVVVPSGRPTKSPGTNGISLAVSERATPVLPSPGYVNSDGRVAARSSPRPVVAQPPQTPISASAGASVCMRCSGAVSNALPRGPKANGPGASTLFAAGAGALRRVAGVAGLLVVRQHAAVGIDVGHVPAAALAPLRPLDDPAGNAVRLALGVERGDLIGRGRGRGGGGGGQRDCERGQADRPQHPWPRGPRWPTSSHPRAAQYAGRVA